jgi:hypothetical protein
MSAPSRCWRLRQLLACVAALCGLLFVSQSTSAGDFDVERITLAKTATLLQLGAGSNSFLQRPLMLEAHAEVLPRQGGGLHRGWLETPASEYLELLKDDRGALYLDASFETMDEWHAAMPNGTYWFDLETTTPPVDYQDYVEFTQRFPMAPTITNSEWYQIVVQMNATQPFTFRWSDFAGFQTATGQFSRIRFEIVDIYDEVIHMQTFETHTTQITIPANLLTPGEFYVGRVFFGHVDQEADSQTVFEAIYAMGTAFIISAVDGPPKILPPLEKTITRGQLFVYVVNATNHPGSFNVANLPTQLAGASVQQGEVIQDTSFGIVAGYPSQSVRWPVSASNSLGTGTDTFSLTVIEPGTLRITSSTAATASKGVAFSYQVLAPGATASARLSAQGLPPGVTANAVSGEISGTPTAAGRFPVELRVTDGQAVATSPLELTVQDDPAFPNITSPDTVTIAPGQNFTYKIEAPAGANTTTDETTYRIVGDLPPGLTFDPKTGTISGKLGGHPARDDKPSEQNPVTGGVIIGNVQLFANNSRGTATIPLVFFTPPTGAVNISTRMPVEAGDNVLIGGFIVTGNAPKKLILRAIGPSLRAGDGPLPGAMQDPVLELYNVHGELLKTNDNWKSENQQAIVDTTVPPSHDNEAAIVAAFDPGSYTAIVRGKNGGTGIGLVELYDLGTASLATDSNAKLAQISTRGRVQTGDNVMIGGFIISNTTSKVIVRAIGPSSGVAGNLADPVLELRDGSGDLIAANDNWRSDQEGEIIATTVPPSDNRESAIVRTLGAGGYTAVVRGAGNSTGIALVEVYVLE